MKLIICDLDGVVNGSSPSVRGHLVPFYMNKSSYWAEWHKAHVNEPVSEDMRRMLLRYSADGWKVVYLSSRQDTCLESTTAQLVGFPGWRILLRPALDDTPPPEFKANTVRTLLALADVDELMLIDDCGSNLKAMREAALSYCHDLCCLHVKKLVAS